MPHDNLRWMELLDDYTARSPTQTSPRSAISPTPPPDSMTTDGPEQNRRKVDSAIQWDTMNDEDFDNSIMMPWREPYPKTIIPLGASGHDLLVWTNSATSYDGSWQFQICKHGETDPAVPAQHNIDVAYWAAMLLLAEPREKVKVTFGDQNGLEVVFRLPDEEENDVIQIRRPPPRSVSTS
ncbi:hypothetical protein HMN09_00888900 [Mycena chlorophos]|uniref:Uncharacterized protein n=1 Tax=Mycena chlorophos TaxID=658473 RepID=A0A8H6W7X4_MYCCL|nr:hypothetical protein HMN09_00888900 [Mycena chlorophos]